MCVYLYNINITVTAHGNYDFTLFNPSPYSGLFSIPYIANSEQVSEFGHATKLVRV